MSKPKFKDLLNLSNKEITDEITNIEFKIFDLKFKKSTKQLFKAHNLKFLKIKLAQLKTLLTIKLTKIE